MLDARTAFLEFQLISRTLCQAMTNSEARTLALQTPHVVYLEWIMF